MFNIFSPQKILRPTDVIMENWVKWKTFNQKANTIFFPIFKDFEDSALRDISGGACKLYIFLGLKARNTGESWYSIQSMAEFLKVSTRTIDKWLQELEDRGLIARDRHSVSSTTYLLPYAINIIHFRPATADVSFDSALENAIQIASGQEDVIGRHYRNFHLFQWIDASQTKCLQAVAVITRKRFKNSEPSYHCFYYYNIVDKPEFVVSESHIAGPKRFSSPYNKPGQAVHGIALEKDWSLTNRVNQKSALTQLCKAPQRVIDAFDEIGWISSKDYAKPGSKPGKEKK